MNDLIKSTLKWTVRISIITFFLAALFTVLSSIFVERLHWSYGAIIVLVIILIGVIFDTIGIAATAACEKPFHAMATKRVNGSKVAIRIIRNADQFANFCNDVIGDIAGIISGAASAAVIIQVLLTIDSNSTIFDNTIKIGVTSLVAALTVGGKSIGKTIAIQYSQEIIFMVSKILNIVEMKLNIKFFDNTKKKKPKRGNRIDPTKDDKQSRNC
ncbi:hypothetical protein BHU72_02410 [Desulfuribacillus stibiiarsenatis]|uniref:CNNM transmembrane domain-containing protein n=1 Tax=Desulfuribacillus stibiiarsenatis TaxID=1390249 RepID=A0A1E5L6S0_9FIRM|nr:hypothetical protein [Desulfuribacillus stibiiarsenatis]OEH85669.1 hypothetical protein BHU72_02410 [Desulfuribacillus stibiiarsenatis]